MIKKSGGLHLVLGVIMVYAIIVTFFSVALATFSNIAN